MKFAIVFACLLALAAAGGDQEAKALHNDAEVNVDSFRYAYDIDNSIKAQQEGHLEGEVNWVVKGEYTYTAPDGTQIKVAYTADDTGYHPDVIP